MHIHLPQRFRVLLSFCIVVIVAMVFFIKSNSRPKNDYPHVTGKIIYLDSAMGSLPTRDVGKYRYLKIENYPYPFEIYADEQGARIDSLKKGDIVTARFYETSNTKEEHINRFLQFLEKNNKLYFKRTDFMANLGYVIIGLSIALMFFFYTLYKKNKIPY